MIASRVCAEPDTRRRRRARAVGTAMDQRVAHPRQDGARRRALRESTQTMPAMPHMEARTPVSRSAARRSARIAAAPRTLTPSGVPRRRRSAATSRRRRQPGASGSSSVSDAPRQRGDGAEDERRRRLALPVVGRRSSRGSDPRSPHASDGCTGADATRRSIHSTRPRWRSRRAPTARAPASTGTVGAN